MLIKRVHKDVCPEIWPEILRNTDASSIAPNRERPYERCVQAPKRSQFASVWKLTLRQVCPFLLGAAGCLNLSVPFGGGSFSFFRWNSPCENLSFFVDSKALLASLLIDQPIFTSWAGMFFFVLLARQFQTSVERRIFSRLRKCCTNEAN